MIQWLSLTIGEGEDQDSMCPLWSMWSTLGRESLAEISKNEHCSTMKKEAFHHQNEKLNQTT